MSELQDEVEKQRIDHKVKIDLQNNQIDQAMHELNKLTIEMRNYKDTIDRKNAESLTYIQEVSKQLRE